MTRFTGIPFSHENPYAYLEAKRVLGLAREDLRTRSDLKRKLGMNPEVHGRGAITGTRSNAVWDLLSLSNAADAKNFTKYPHLTLGITALATEVMVTAPNAISGTIRGKLKELGEEGFRDVVGQVVGNMRPLLRKHPGAAPWFRGVQRRYKTQRSVPFLDAQIDFDLRTAIRSGKPIKAQPAWLAAGYGSFAHKRGANYQIQVGVIFKYERCLELRDPSALDVIADSWLACKPFIDLMR